MESIITGILNSQTTHTTVWSFDSSGLGTSTIIVDVPLIGLLEQDILCFLRYLKGQYWFLAGAEIVPQNDIKVRTI